jgi:carbamoylphosphate synthase small subunit
MVISSNGPGDPEPLLGAIQVARKYWPTISHYLEFVLVIK